MSTNAAYASTPRYEVTQVSTANTAWDGTGTIEPIFTAGTDGSRVDNIGWAVAGTSSAGLLKFFVRESSTETWRYITSAPIPAISASATTAPHFDAAHNLNWIMTAGAQIGCAPSVATTINIHVFNAGDF